MTAAYQYKYRVTGADSFPLDMLRYDGSSFAHETEANREQLILERQFDDRRFERRTVTLLRVWDHLWHPNVDRWASFGWTVESDVERHKF